MTFILRKKIKEAEKRILGIRELIADIERVSPFGFTRMGISLIKSLVFSYNTISLINLILGELAEVQLDYAWDGKVAFKLDLDKNYLHNYNQLMTQHGFKFDWFDKQPKYVDWVDSPRPWREQSFYNQYTTSGSYYVTTTSRITITTGNFTPDLRTYYDNPTIRLTPYTYPTTTGNTADES